MKEVKAKKETIESKTKDFNEKAPDDAVNLDSFESVCDTIYYSIKHSVASEKQEYLRNLIVSIYVKERRNALVNGRIPVSVQAQNVGYKSISRDTRFVIPTFEFNFRVKLPKANKERLILQRNKLGQIVKSKVPDVLSYN